MNNLYKSVTGIVAIALICVGLYLALAPNLNTLTIISTRDYTPYQLQIYTDDYRVLNVTVTTTNFNLTLLAREYIIKATFTKDWVSQKTVNLDRDKSVDLWD